MLKRLAMICLICIILGLLISCGPTTGTIEDFEVVVTDGSKAATREVVGEDSGSNRSFYKAPEGVKIAFSKVWFPAGDTYHDLLDSDYALPPDSSSSHSGGVSVVFTGFEAVSGDGYFKAINEETIIDATEGAARSCDILPSHSTTYKGVLIEYSYFEIDVGNYIIRYYTQDHDGDYKRKDISIKHSGNDWDNNYAYWVETTTYDYTYDADGGENFTDDPPLKHTYDNIVQTYKLVVENTRPVGGYDLRPEHPIGPQQIVDARIEADLTEHPDSADSGPYDPVFRNISLAREVDWNGMLNGRYLIGGYKEEDLMNPHSFTTDPVDANTAKSYIYGIDINLAGSTDDSPSGLQFGSSLDFNALDTFEKLVSIDSSSDPFTICPITGGIEVAIGWEDFDGRLNGAYYHVEDDGPSEK